MDIFFDFMDNSMINEFAFVKIFTTSLPSFGTESVPETFMDCTNRSELSTRKEMTNPLLISF